MTDTTSALTETQRGVGRRRIAAGEARTALIRQRYAAPPAEVVGAEAMHRVLRGWLADLGQEAYR